MFQNTYYVLSRKVRDILIGYELCSKRLLRTFS